MKADPKDAGCWIDGHAGHYSSAHLILIAKDWGWEDQEAIDMAVDYFKGEYPEGLFDAADDAELYLNENVAPEGYSFGWFQTEFFLWKNETWDEEEEGCV